MTEVLDHGSAQSSSGGASTCGGTFIRLARRDGSTAGYAQVDPEDYPRLAEHRWHLNAQGYAARGERRADGSTQIFLMARELLDLKPGDGLCVDHISRDRLDNRRANLRIVTKAENGQNRSLNVNNKSGVRGVSWSQRHSKWTAYGRANKKCKFLGYFEDLTDAAQAVSDWRAANLPYSTN